MQLEGCQLSRVTLTYLCYLCCSVRSACLFVWMNVSALSFPVGCYLPVICQISLLCCYNITYNLKVKELPSAPLPIDSIWLNTDVAFLQNLRHTNKMRAVSECLYLHYNHNFTLRALNHIVLRTKHFVILTPVSAKPTLYQNVICHWMPI